MLEILTTVLQGGGNAALIAIAAAVWRIDRRVLRLEIMFSDHLKEEHKRHEMVH